MIPAPHTYAEWVNVLEIFKSKSDDFEVLEAMQNGTIEWQAGVADRFVKRLIDAVNDRLNYATDKLNKDMQRAGWSEGALVQALLTARKEYAFLARAINLPVLPEKDRQQYVQLVVDYVNERQEQLEQSALDNQRKYDRSGKLLSIVKNHKVNAI